MSTTRRKFAQTITAATAALPILATDLLGQKTSEAPAPLAIALTGVVAAQSGRHLTEAEMQRISENLKEYVPFLERLREYELANTDEPDFTFHARVQRW